MFSQVKPTLANWQSRETRDRQWQNAPGAAAPTGQTTRGGTPGHTAIRHPALSTGSAEEPGSCFRRLPERYRALPVWHGAATLSARRTREDGGGRRGGEWQ